MDELERHERRREAWMRLRAQRRRAGELRGRVVAVSLICFVLLWGVVFAQMATGNDPVLGEKSAARSPSSAGVRTHAKQRPEAESGVSTDAEEDESEALAEVVEPEVVEPEVVEPEPELESLVTGQS